MWTVWVHTSLSLVQSLWAVEGFSCGGGDPIEHRNILPASFTEIDSAAEGREFVVSAHEHSPSQADSDGYGPVYVTLEMNQNP